MTEKKLIIIGDESFTPLIYAGGFEGFRKPDCPGDLMHRVALSSIFDEDGNYNPASSFAEQYALSLYHDEKEEASLRLFEMIVEGTPHDRILFNHGSAKPATANIKGHLGFLGLLRYSQLLSSGTETERVLATKYMVELVEKLPLTRTPGSMARTRYEALLGLKRLGLRILNNLTIPEHMEKELYCVAYFVGSEGR